MAEMEKVNNILDRLHKVLEDIEERLHRVEYILDKAKMNTSGAAAPIFGGGTWEISERQIAQWVAGTTHPLGDSSS